MIDHHLLYWFILEGAQLPGRLLPDEYLADCCPTKAPNELQFFWK
jgi:hypothetical protein